MNTELNNKYNKGIAQITALLYKLRQIECRKGPMDSKYSTALPILTKVTKLLLKKRNFLLYRPMWDELHDRSVYYYDYLNETNLAKIKDSPKNIPIFRVTLHNEAIKWWLKYKHAGHLSSTLVHFDTHDDMGLPKTKKYLLTRGKLDTKKVMKGACGLISWPVTCLLLSEEVENVIWCLPQWVHDTDITIEEQALVHYKKGDDFRYIRSKTRKKDKYRLEGDVTLLSTIERTKGMDFYHAHAFSRVKMTTTKGWNKLARLIQTPRFILDIDLDFFVTNGDKYSRKEYLANYFEDIESTGRVHTVPGITVPRAAYEDHESRKVSKKLNAEFKLIKKRVKSFLKGLALLKQKGLKPCCITLSDSAPSFFSGDPRRAVWTNCYTPKYFVPALHDLLTKGLTKLY